MAVQAAPLISWGGDEPQSVAVIMGETVPYIVPAGHTWVPAPSAVSLAPDQGMGYATSG
jgi:hypothetical protein